MDRENGSFQGGRVSRREFLRAAGILGVGSAALAACGGKPPQVEAAATPATATQAPAPPAQPVDVERIAADPTDIPGPVSHTQPRTHQVELDAQEVVAEIEPGVTFTYMTFGGRVPGPMIRVRQGDSIQFTLKNLPDSAASHNIDLHAVYGTGGGSIATNVSPGQSNGLNFKAVYPGAFMYHCAVPNLDFHISSGMFGMILVEPTGGLEPIDHEFYLGQHEVYTNLRAGEKGHHAFDFAAMLREDPTYVLLNGEKYALTADRRGAMQVKVGERARVFFVNGGPNLTSSFHPIGNVWTKAWRDGALASSPEEYVQTLSVPPGSCGVFEMDFPVPGDARLVDHALTRVVSKGMLGIIEVAGEPVPEIFEPDLPGDPQ
ncbi:MAG TPA: copper-containing nitrite reductase [Anaerolineales bacterium]|nr:copper-containing nitrite reductase [Anaerolineales bacterium]